MSRSLGFKLGAIALLILLLMIPLLMIDGLVDERQHLSRNPTCRIGWAAFRFIRDHCSLKAVAWAERSDTREDGSTCKTRLNTACQRLSDMVYKLQSTPPPHCRPQDREGFRK